MMPPLFAGFFTLASLLGMQDPDSTTWFRQQQALENPAAPGLLIIDVPYLTLQLRGEDRTDILIEARYSSPKASSGPLLSDPLRSLRTEKALNAVFWEMPKNNALLEARIRVPRAISLKVSGSNGGLITIEHVQGLLEVTNANAGIALRDISGGVVANTSNGPITASFQKVAPDTPMSFITENAAIEVRFPAGLKATVHMETDNSGDLHSDFPITPSKTRLSPYYREKLPSGSQHRFVYGDIGGGGPIYRFQTSNNSIKIIEEDP